MKKILLFAGISCALLATSCKPDAFSYHYYTPEEETILTQYLKLPELPADYAVTLPSYLSFGGLIGGGFAQPPISSKVELGRVLFYDKNLSRDGKISCASCHKQELGFGDNASVSKGVFGRSGERNSIALSAVPSFAGAYENTGNSLFWDNRAKTVQEQSRASLANTKEMDMSMPEVVAAVNNQPYYAVLFKKTFGDATATEERVTEAIQGFVHALAAVQSKYDEAAQAAFNPSAPDFNFASKDFSKFTAAENRGKSIYLANCSNCHTTTLTAPFIQSASNGLDLNPADLGAGGITHLTSDEGTFKVPALRNVALTAPYMHDGRFQTLEQVIEHYSSGIQQHQNLHPELRNTDGSPKKFNFSQQDKDALLAFLNTLTDTKMVADVRYSDPFK